MKNQNYITNIDPNYFGSSLKNYSERVQKIVDDVTRKIETSLRFPQNLFSELLIELAEKRKEMAIDQNTPQTYKFGERRDGKTALLRGECHFYTNLTGVYSEYGKKLLEKLQEQVLSGSFEIRFSSAFLKTIFTWELLSYEELDQRGFLHPSREALGDAFRSLQSAFYPVDEKPLRLQKFSELLEKNKLCAFLGAPTKERKIFLGILMRENGGKRELLSQYYTRVHLDAWEAPMILHMDYFQIEEMLEEMQDLFLMSIQWDFSQKPLLSLHKHIAKFRYLFSHTMPFSRGSASIQEWLVSAIYQLYGYKLSYSEAKGVDLEAFTTFSFEKFLQIYLDSLDLKPL